jgi:hypothetical protein
MRLKQNIMQLFVLVESMRGKDKVEAMRGYAAMCKTNYIFSVFFLFTITFYSYYFFFYLIPNFNLSHTYTPFPA